MRIKPLIIALASISVFLIPTQDSKVGHPASVEQIITKPKIISKLPEPSVAPKALLASKTVVKPPEASGNTAQATSTGNPGNTDKAFIYEHESGNNPNAVNPGGCRGLGQACPGSKLPCGDDYACQDAFFTKYAMERYGSWANARSFWESNRWW